MRIERAWAMPSRSTFSIPPISALLDDEMDGGFWIDPYSGGGRRAQRTNDLNPEVDADCHMDALDFLRTFPDSSVDGVLFDPPYSPRQVSECYKGFGMNVTGEDTRASFWGEQKKEIARIVRPGGKVITFGWNSGGGGRQGVRVHDHARAARAPRRMAQRHDMHGRGQGRAGADDDHVRLTEG